MLNDVDFEAIIEDRDTNVHTRYDDERLQRMIERRFKKLRTISNTYVWMENDVFFCDGYLKFVPTEYGSIPGHRESDF